MSRSWIKVHLQQRFAQPAQVQGVMRAEDEERFGILERGAFIFVTGAPGSVPGVGE